jgi:hypothetical protein
MMLSASTRLGAYEIISRAVLTPDGESYAYGCSRLISDIFVVDGLQ